MLSYELEILIASAVNCEGSVFKKMITEKGLGTDINAAVDDYGHLTVVSVAVKNLKCDADTLYNELNKLWRELDKEKLGIKWTAAKNSALFFLKARDFGYKPEGLVYGLMLMDTVMSGEYGFKVLNFAECFEKAEKADIKKTIREYFLDKGCIGVLKKGDEQNTEEIPPQNDGSLIIYHEQTDSEEAVNSIQVTKPSDIKKEPKQIEYECLGENTFIPLKTDDIIYVDLYFDGGALTNEELTALGVYPSAIHAYDTELMDRLAVYVGSLSVEGFSFRKADDSYKTGLSFEFQLLSENIDKVKSDIAKLFALDFKDDDIFSAIKSRMLRNIEQYYVSAGNVRLMNSLLGMYTNRFNYFTREYPLFEALKNDTLSAERVNNAVSKLLTKANVSYSVASGAGLKKKALTFAKELIELLPEGNSVKAGSSVVLPKTNLIYSANTDVCFNAVVCDFSFKDHSMLAARQALTTEYIWDNIRIRGGAYGGSCGFVKNKAFYASTYRDPNVKESIDILKKCGLYLAENKFTQNEVDRFIIGVISKVDAPINNGELNDLAVSERLYDLTYEKRLKNREELLSATPEKLKKCGECLDAALKDCVTGTIASKEALKRYGMERNAVDISLQ